MTSDLTAATAAPKRKLSNDTLATNATSNKARKYVAINPPRSRSRPSSILRGVLKERLSDPPTPCAHIACRLSEAGTCRKKLTGCFTLGDNDTGVEEEGGKEDDERASPNTLPDASATIRFSQPKKSVSWHPSVSDPTRTQQEVRDYRMQFFGEPKWWEDDWQLKVCECTLTHRRELLDALLGLKGEDVDAIVKWLPGQVREMVREVARIVREEWWVKKDGGVGEGEKEKEDEDNKTDMKKVEGEEKAGGDHKVSIANEGSNDAEPSDDGDWDEDAGDETSSDDGYGDEASSKAEGSSENAQSLSIDEDDWEDTIEETTSDDDMEDESQKNDDNSTAAAEKIAHQRALLDFFDSQLKDYIFCRYQGTVRLATDCPIADIQKRGIQIVDEMGKNDGPTAYIVSWRGAENQPLLFPIRFSQAYMAMKMHRRGEDSRPWIERLDAYAGSCGTLANAVVASAPWIADDRLLVRTQSWIYTHDQDPGTKELIIDFLSGEDAPVYGGEDSKSWMCAHLFSDPERYHLNFTQTEESAKLRRCEKCAMEYRIDIVKGIPADWSSAVYHPVNEQAFCAVVTVWRDFGRCLTPYDPRWAAHFSEYESKLFEDDFPAANQAVRDAGEEEPATDWELGGIMRAYEGVDEYDTELSLRGYHLKRIVSTPEERRREDAENLRKEMEKQQAKRQKVELERRRLREELYLSQLGEASTMSVGDSLRAHILNWRRERGEDLGCEVSRCVGT